MDQKNKKIIYFGVFILVLISIGSGLAILNNSANETITRIEPEPSQHKELSNNDQIHIENNGLAGHTAYISFSENNLNFPKGKLVVNGASVPDVQIINGDIWVYFVDTENAHVTENNISAVYSEDDGETWSDTITIEIEGVEDDVEPVDPSIVVLENGQVRMYYYDFPYGGVQQDTSDFYSATSDDGIHFVVDQLVLSINKGNTDPDVIQRGDEWFLYYVETGDPEGGIGLATSNDGLNFTNQGYIDSAELTSIPTAIVLDDMSIRLYSCLNFSGISEDGMNFTVDKKDKFLQGGGACDPSIVEYKNEYILVYKEIVQTTSNNDYKQ